MKIIIQLYILSYILLLTACKKDFLDSAIKNTLIRQEYVVNLNTSQEFLNGIYLSLNITYGGYCTIYPELAGDNIKPIAGFTTLSSHYNWQQRATDDASSAVADGAVNMNGYAYCSYNAIASCNFIITKADEFRQENPTKADEIKGQAYAIRALLHFNLLNVFAQSYNFTADGTHPGVVYKTNADWTESAGARLPVTEVYKRIAEDLNKAIGLLPDAVYSTMIMNRNAAKSLLARLFLYQQDYTSAKNIATEVSAKVPLMTIGNGYPNDLYKVLTPLKTEVIFQLQPGTLLTYGALFSGYYFRAAKPFLATADIALMLTEKQGDVRRSWVASAGGNWNINKFPSGIIPDANPISAGYYHTVVRSSEMFLTAAESYAKLNMEDSARFFLDAVRKRADPTVIGSTASGSSLLDSIYKERRKEFSFEGYRLYDLLRLKKDVIRGDVAGASPQILNYPSNYAIAPLPGLDVKVGGISQNIGY